MVIIAILLIAIASTTAEGRLKARADLARLNPALWISAVAVWGFIGLAVYLG